MLTEKHGGNVLSLFPETLLLLLKLLKSTKETNSILIHTVLAALARCIKGAGKAASDANVKELYKIAKNYATGKNNILCVDGVVVGRLI